MNTDSGFTAAMFLAGAVALVGDKPRRYRPPPSRPLNSHRLYNAPIGKPNARRYRKRKAAAEATSHESRVTSH